MEKLNAVEIMDELINKRHQIQERCTYLKHKIEVIRKKELDLNHVTEIYDFNASQMCKLTIMRKEILRERRSYKDEMEELNPLLLVLNQASNTSKAYKNIKKQTYFHKNNEKDRCYNVRVMKELFGDILTEENKPKL